MARQFGSYSPSVPLGTTWEESLVLEDENDDPINLTGYAVRAQLREALPVLDDEGAADNAPLLELTTDGYYAEPPDWPVYAGWTVPEPTNGTLLLEVPPDEFAVCAPTNEKTKLVWDVRLVNTDTGYTIPVVIGKPTFLPAVTL